MAVPQGRNQKKHKRKSRMGAIPPHSQFSLNRGYTPEAGSDYEQEEDYGQEEWSLDNPGPGLDERLLMLAHRRDHFLERTPSFLDRYPDNDDYDDFDEISSELADEMDTWWQ
ncbi:hypothetical protein ACFLX3_05435 [Chloroflexota bacterium]